MRTPGGNVTTIELISNGVWNGNMKVNETGIYSLTFNAVDESNTFADPVNIDFKVILLGSSGIFGGFAPSVGVPPTAY